MKVTKTSNPLAYKLLLNLAWRLRSARMEHASVKAVTKNAEQIQFYAGAALEAHNSFQAAKATTAAAMQGIED